MTSFKLPDIGEGIQNVTVTDILVTENQSVKEDDIVIIVESEKASMEIPINQNCSILKIHVKKGDKISTDDTILTFRTQSITKNNEIEKNEENTLIFSGFIPKEYTLMINNQLIYPKNKDGSFFTKVKKKSSININSEILILKHPPKKNLSLPSE